MPFCPFAIDVIYLSVNIKGISVFGGAYIFYRRKTITDIKNYKLVIPDETYEKQYTEMMDKWESIEDNIQPQLLRRYSKSLGENVSYSKWLEWCVDKVL